MHDEFNPQKLDYAAIHKQMQDRIDSMPPFENDGLAHLENIDKNTDDIAARFASEAKMREVADIENMRYVKKWNRINLTVAVVGVLIGLAGFGTALIALLPQ